MAVERLILRRHYSVASIFWSFVTTEHIPRLLEIYIQ